MNYKRKLLSALVASVLMLSACGGPQLVDDSKVSDEDKVQLDQEYSFTVGTSSSGGTVYAVGAGISNLLGERIEGLSMRAVATGGAVDNIGLMEKGEVQFALNAANTNFMATEGTLSGMEKQDNLRTIVSLYPSVIHFLVSKESGITGFDQLQGTSGSVGAAGSASECYSEDILSYYGYDYRNANDVEPVFTSTSSAVDLFKDGHIDWGFFPLGVPGANVMDLCMSGKVNILPIEGEDRDNILEKYNYYVPYTIPGGTYQGIDNDLDTVACAVILTCDESVDEEVVNQITKTIWENIGDVQMIADSLKWMTQETATSGLGAPMHPGAERYYKEIGWIE